MPSPTPPLILWFSTPVIALAIAAHGAPTQPSLVWMALCLAALLALAATLRRRPRIGAGPWLLIAGTATICAALTVDAHRQSTPHPILDWLGEDRLQAEVTGLIVDGPIDHERGFAYDLKLESIDIDPDGRWTDPAPTLRFFLPSDLSSPCDPLPLPGDRLRTWATLERFPPSYAPHQHSLRQHMEARGYSARATAREAIQPLDGERTPTLRLRRHLNLQRISLERRVQSHLDDPHAIAMAHAMLTGSRGRLSDEFRAPFDITSTGHILAISGLHFGVIAALLAFLFGALLDRFPRLYLHRPRRSIIGLFTLGALFIYLLAIGAPVSAQRAFAMASLAILFLCFSPWRLSPITALIATATAMIIYRPSIIAAMGFQLSVFATASILLIHRFRPPALRAPSPLETDRSERRLTAWRRRTLHFIAISLAATVGTWPTLLMMTGELPIAGLWANLIVVPLVSLLLFPILVAGALATTLSSTAAGLLLELSTRGLLALHTFVDTAAYAPGSVWRLGTPSALEFSCLLIACFVALSACFRPRALLLAFLVALLGYTPGVLTDRLQGPTLEVHFIDVDQGDATLIITPDDRSILIDGGGRPVGSDPGLTRVAPYLRHQGIQRLDKVIVTHADFDHYGGLFALARPFRPRTLILDGRDADHPRLRELSEVMDAQGATLLPLETHHRIRTPSLDLAVLRPDLYGASANDRSLSVDFSYGGAGVLLASDLEARGEDWIIDRVVGRRALIKMPHHGSRTSSTAPFIDALEPALAISSSGRHSRFGHPHDEVLQRYQRRGVHTYGTHQHGSVIATLSPDGTIDLRTTRGLIGTESGDI